MEAANCADARHVSLLQHESCPDVLDVPFAHVFHAQDSFGVVGQTASTRGMINALNHLSLGQASGQKIDGHYRFSSIHEGVFTADETTQRAIKISSGPRLKALDHLQARFNVSMLVPSLNDMG